MVKNRTFIAISFLFGVASTLFVWFGEFSSGSILLKEDGIVETLSAIFYMIALIISFISIFKTERVCLPIIWVVLCFIFLGEEVSWFQRLFHYSVPWVEQINAQNEFNLHNLTIFQSKPRDSFIELLRSFLNSQNLFRIGFFSYFLVIPFVVYIPILRRLASKIGYKKPMASFTLVLFLVFALSFFLALITPEDAIRSLANIRSTLSETREMLYAFFIMQYVIAYIWTSKKKTLM